MGQPFYGGTADCAVDYTNPYLARGADYYNRNPYAVYAPTTTADSDRRYNVKAARFVVLSSLSSLLQPYTLTFQF